MKLDPPEKTLQRASSAGLLAGLLLCVWACSPSPPPEQAVTYRLETLIEGNPFHGIHGLTFDAEDQIWVGSVVGQSIYRVDPASGEVELKVAPPIGVADDLEFDAEGRLVWTALFRGQVLAQAPGGPVEVLAEGLPAVNSIAFNEEGRLFVSEVFHGDALWEIDPKGETEPRKILEDMGGLNGFDFGPDGKIYGPLWFKGVIARIDVDAGTIETAASGFAVPAAANFDSKGQLWVLDTEPGQVWKVDPSTGEKTLVAEVDPSLDNLAIDSQDRLFITNMANNGIYEIDTETGESRTVVEGKLALPGALTLIEEEGREILHVADVFSYRTVDIATKEVRDIVRVYQNGAVNPVGIALGQDKMLISFFFESALQIFDRKTSELLKAIDLPMAGPVVALGGDSWLVATIAGGDLLLVDSELEIQRTITSGLGEPAALALAGAGKVYVSECSAGVISEIDIESGERRVIAEHLSQPEGIAVAPEGHILVAEVGARALSRIDPASGEREILAEDLPIGLPVPEGMPISFIPTGVAVSSAGVIYLSSDVDTAIYRLVPSP